MTTGDIWGHVLDDGRWVGNLAAEDSFLFLWVTDNFLKDGMRVMEMWDFDYKRCFVWVKPSVGLGFYARSRHELCLLGVRGNPPRARRRSGGSSGFDVPPSVIFAEKLRHSKKPEAFYEIIEGFKSSPESRCVELFARNTRDGWESLGNEV